MSLRYDDGSVLFDGDPLARAEHSSPSSDSRLLARRRHPAYRYRAVREALDDAGVDYEDAVLDPLSDSTIDFDADLRPYQRAALDRWGAEERGVVVLPTGAGKTYVGVAAVAHTRAPTLVVVPTLDLVDQWRREFADFGVDAGEFTGREKRLAPVTVTTYDSAHEHAGRLGDRFGLAVFDEVHHLAAESYATVAERLAAPARLGLTATYERPDGAHERLRDLLGGRVYEVDTDDLTGEYLAEYTVQRITVDLTPGEREAYEERFAAFRNYVAFSNVSMDGPNGYRKLVMRSGNDPKAWRAVRGHTESRRVAFGAAAKLDELGHVLADCASDDRIIVFTRHNDLVHRIADRFLLPSITHETDGEERRRTLDRFREGTYRAVASSQVLDEGVDVPAANVGVIVSGTGSEREYRQRLGRILRPDGGPARLYELVTADTGEVRTADRRRG